MSKRKAMGIVRKVDELGRIVLPIELRRSFEIAEKDLLEFFVEEDSIVLKKYSPVCTFCSETSDLTVHQGRNICASCLKKLRR